MGNHHFMLLGFLVGCELDDRFLTETPTDPVFAMAEASCSADELSLTALVDSSPIASTTHVRVSAGADLVTWWWWWWW